MSDISTQVNRVLAAESNEIRALVDAKAPEFVGIPLTTAIRILISQRDDARGELRAMRMAAVEQARLRATA